MSPFFVSAAGLVVAGVALAAAGGCASAPAQTDNVVEIGRAQGAPARGGALASVSAQDRRFVAEALPAGLAEVELGRLALQRARHPQVRAFARRMVDDHGDTNERLRAFAGHYAIDAPARLGHAHQDLKQRLAGLDGPAFDRAYIDNQVQEHRRQLAAYERQAAGGSAAALQALAQTVAPVLEEHLRAAQTLARTLDGAP